MNMKTKLNEYLDSEKKSKKDRRLMNPKKTTLREDLGEEKIREIKKIHKRINENSISTK